MNIVVLAAAERGFRCLSSLYSGISRDDLVSVFTFPEDPWEPPFVKKISNLAKGHGSNVVVTNKVHSKEFTSFWEQNIDVIFVIGWRYLIPREIYESAKFGCFVFHDSLLPKYRGFGPSVWAIKNGEKYTGTTLFKISDEMDEGPILFQEKVAISPKDYIADLVEKITSINEKLILDALNCIKSNKVELYEQNHKDATYTCKNIPSDFQINWKESSKEVFNLIRSYSSPYPGAFSFLNEQKMVVLKASIDIENRTYVGSIPGRIKSINSDGSVSVFCGNDSSIRLLEVMIENSSANTPSQFIKSIGDTFVFKN